METKQGERLHATASQGASIVHAHRILEAMGAKGTYRVNMTRPSKEDLPGFLRLRELVARLEMKATIERAQARRIELYEEASELSSILVKVPQIITFEDEFPNVVATVGKNVLLDAGLAGSSYTVVGPYMGLISSTSYTGVLAADTMTSHGGWLEAGNANAPTYTSPRKTCVWSAASAGAKALSAALSYAMTGTGTVKGCFIDYFTGALSTIDNTAGTLLSAGLFTGGDQPTVSGNTLNVSYSLAV